MFKRITLMLAIFLFSFEPLAISQGSWTKDSAGGHVSVGRQHMPGQPLHAPASIPASAKITRIQWHISLLNAAPPQHLVIKLCHAKACHQLDGLSGQFTPNSSWPANGSYYFIYSVETPGQLRPPLRVVRNGLTVNYN